MFVISAILTTALGGYDYTNFINKEMEVQQTAKEYSARKEKI